MSSTTPNKRSSTATAAAVPAGGSSGSVDFILRTAMERQSGNKRPIRPKIVDDSLLADDSDDSDFNVDDHGSVSGSDVTKDSNSSDASGSDDNEDGNDSHGGSDSDVVPESKSSLLREAIQKLNNESPGFHPPGGARKKKKTTKAKKKVVAGKKPIAKNNGKALKSKKKTVAPISKKNEKKKSNPYAGCVMDRVFKATCAMRDIRSDIDLNRKICSFCLGERSDGSNEIVECDSCKITVHEGCYGISDCLSVCSDSSSSSATEPWFCDFCKNPDSRCSCALCPNPGGLLKATAEEQFVHLVCAHYTRGILSRVDNKAYLERIPYSKWGNKPCTLCSSARFATTGITVECDAGLCKQYVHISCAQKFGLLSDPSSAANEDDLLYASCKLHGQREHAKQRATLFKVLQEQIRIKREKSSFNLTSAVRLKQGRIQEKLRKVQSKIAAKRSTNPDGTSLASLSVCGYKLPNQRSCVPNMQLKRKPRNLKSCAYSVSKFLQKIENMGGDITSLELEEKNERIVANIKKRWNVLPSLTVEFAAYYFDREARIETLSKQCQELVKENEDLNDRQIALNTVLENEAVDHMEIMDDTLTMNSELTDLRNILKAFSPGNNSINTSTVLKGLSPTRPKSPVRKPSVPVPKQKRSTTGSMELKKTLARTSLPSDPGRLTLHICAICKKSEQQHLITKCDNCALNFHLACLDPPLTRMPRRSRLVGWMCSDCCEVKSEEEDVIDTEAPRSLRGRTQLKRPEKYRGNEDSEEEIVMIKEKPGSKPPPVSTHEEPGIKAIQEGSVAVPFASIPNPDLLHLKKQNKAAVNGISNTNTGDLNAPGVSLHYSNVNLLKRTCSSSEGLIRPATFTPPQALAPKKMKISPGTPTELETLSDSTLKLASKKAGAGAVSPSNRFVPILPKPSVKEEKISPKKACPKSAKGKIALSASNNSLLAPALSLLPESKHSEINGVSPGPKISNVSKKLKLVLSPLNSEPGRKNGKIESISPRGTATPQASPRSGSVPDKKTTPKLSKTTKLRTPPKDEADSKNQRKASSRTIQSRVQNKIKSNLNNWNAIETAETEGNDNTKGVTPSSQDGSFSDGKCSVCTKAEEKKNLVMCDECSLEFHFTCVPPFMPYNPKRRGYTWVCEGCANKSDEEVCFAGGSNVTSQKS